MANPILFGFTDGPSAVQALDTLKELGFEAKLAVQLQLDGGSLTSALEIVQAYGGTWLETGNTQSDEAAFHAAYGLDGVPIPAHMVTEDLPAGYMNAAAEERGSNGDTAAGERGGDEGTSAEAFVPAGDDVDAFPVGIHV